MNRIFQNFCYFISVVSLIGGFADLIIQFYEGQEVNWRVPLILIGTGVGIPVIILPFYTPSEPKEDNMGYDDNDVSSAYPDEEGFLSRSNNSGSSADYEDHGGPDGTD